ncbi:gluconate 2-dehydrogenase subunit 3 family protein [Aquimarina sp. 2201CG5-10]|uniref:gluconate 2-dehydrogenase subunit 3 family protein n=1 Tax=Aquimarina callyspongiae TaxID=3098150 RepID=UPI002AB3FB7C|nr:gluconate 2-dehydrogenase subunit 3 family protein [Aquimarina sp. 2201CG5-10]MDY8138000.1 gluconate 2-dehydrogenase subunit 3 family protein [Aquimarina sp. 2201CG5-10]
MNRREALKNIGLSASYIAATPSILSILQSCTKEIIPTWTPELLSIDEAKILDRIVDLIIPETENIPGALAVNVPMFIEKFILHGVEEKEEIEKFKKSATIVLRELGVSEEKKVDKITIEEYDTLLTKYLRSSKEQQLEYTEEMQDVKTSEDMDSISKDAIIFNYLSSVRGLSIWGFKTSQEIGKNVLAYAPVPGEQIGCDSLEKLTGGKAWSL